jgi:hypothetical protein
VQLELDGEIIEEGDRVRLKDTINGIKATALCEIVKIRSKDSIQILCVYDHAKATVKLSEIELN